MYEIQVGIHREAELYNPLDPRQELLSSEVVAYIVRKYDECPRGERHMIRIVSETPVDEARVRRNIVAYTAHEKDILGKRQRRNVAKQLALFAIGVAFIGMWLVLAARTENILVEVFSIIGSFAVWEAANIWIVEGPETRIERRRLERMKSTEVAFSYVERLSDYEQ